MKQKKKKVERLLNKTISKNSSIAFISSFCLGDGLISLVTVNNLVQHGYCVNVFGDYAYAMKDWFPQFSISPQITPIHQQVLKNYDLVLHMYESELSRQVAKWHPMSITLSDSKLYSADMTMTDIQVSLCKREFALGDVERINNITPLPDLVYRKHLKRIVIHPTSSLLRKNWPPKKFLTLASQLKAEGYDINFIVSPIERPDWLWVEKENFKLPEFASLNGVAKFVYESGFFIGNDSGIGHLASNLGIPTVSIILRKGVAKQWRPSWAPGKVVLSPSWVNPRPIKEKLWKIFTTVSMVKKAFDNLERESHASFPPLKRVGRNCFISALNS